MSEKVVNAALLGLGTVGTGVYKVIKNQEQEMTAKLGRQVKITKILVRNLEKASKKVEDPSVLTTDWADIGGDSSIDIVIELIGGIEPARTYILAALKAGKNVVTANKDLIAVHGKEILETAKAAQKDFLFEAAVAGGIPIISPLKNSLEGQPCNGSDGNRKRNYDFNPHQDVPRNGFQMPLLLPQSLDMQRQILLQI